MRAGARLAGVGLVHRLLAVIAVAGCGAAPIGRTGPAVPCSSHRVGQVTVTGAARSAVPQLVVLEGTLDDPERTERIAGVAADGLRAQGYADAAIAVARRAGCGVDLDVRVTLGPRYQIAWIAFDTDDEFPGPERLAVLEDALGTVNTVGGVYIEYRMRRALVELERRYRDAGWLEARLGAPRTTYDRSGTVAVDIPIVAGRRFRIGSVRAVGAGPLALVPEAVVDVLAPHVFIEVERGVVVPLDRRVHVSFHQGSNECGECEQKWGIPALGMRGRARTWYDRR